MKINLNNTVINYTEHGIPKGLPVVFIHGFPFSHEMWKPQIQTLPKNIRAITYDVRGHGFSDVGDGQFTIELFVDRVVLNKLLTSISEFLLLFVLVTLYFRLDFCWSISYWVIFGCRVDVYGKLSHLCAFIF